MEHRPLPVELASLSIHQSKGNRPALRELSVESGESESTNSLPTVFFATPVILPVLRMPHPSAVPETTAHRFSMLRLFVPIYLGDQAWFRAPTSCSRKEDG